MSDKKSNVAWISGAYYAAKPLLDKIKEKTKDVDCFTCTSETPFSKLYLQLISNQCFSSNRFVLITGIPEMTEAEKKKFKNIIESLSEDIFVVFYMIEPGDERAIFNSVSKVGKIYHVDPIIPLSDAKSWLDDRLEKLNIDIEDKAKIALLDNCGIVEKGNTKGIYADIIEASIKKIILFDPNKKCYDLNDVISTSSFYDNFIIWNLLSSCDSRNYETCLNMFDKCVLSNNNAIEALNQIINTLLWKYRLLLFLKEKFAQNIDKESIVEMASSIRKISYTGVGLSSKARIETKDSNKEGEDLKKSATIWNSWTVNMNINNTYGKKSSLEIYNRKELYLIVKFLEDAITLARLCEGENEAYLIADIIFMNICNVLDSSSMKKIQNSLLKLRT